MKFTPSKVNIFLLLKLPSAFISGVRMKEINEDRIVVTVKHRWMNQNPFKSLYWAVQGMASELTTGILVMREINQTGKKISMLVTHQSGRFTKKAKGRITFTCTDGSKIKEALENTITTGEGETVTLISEGTDESGDTVSRFEYEWSLRVKK